MKKENQTSSNLSVISLPDLETYSTKLIEQTCAHVIKEYKDKDKGVYLSVEQVMKTLGVSRPTLNRWEKAHYLVPVRVGVRLRYKLTDINRILQIETKE